ncbi:MAG: isoprenylcysteine carboxylmethyltransferase family protein [Acidobacteriota bacterium]
MTSSLLGLDTRWWYTALVALVALQRLAELRVAKRNTRRLLARGGVEVGAGHYPFMVVLHTVFLFAAVAEPWLFSRPWNPGLALVAFIMLLLSAGLRWWVIRTLDGRWTTRVIYVSDWEPVTAGPYRYLRHPNYLAVVTEILVLPLVHGAWLTAMVASLLNAWLLRVRIAAEEKALRDHCDPRDVLAQRPRMLPLRGSLPGQAPPEPSKTHE